MAGFILHLLRWECKLQSSWEEAVLLWGLRLVTSHLQNALGKETAIYLVICLLFDSYTTTKYNVEKVGQFSNVVSVQSSYLTKYWVTHTRVLTSCLIFGICPEFSLPKSLQSWRQFDPSLKPCTWYSLPASRTRCVVHVDCEEHAALLAVQESCTRAMHALPLNSPATPQPLVGRGIASSCVCCYRFCTSADEVLRITPKERDCPT
jgi:hypothetical protein